MAPQMRPLVAQQWHVSWAPEACTAGGPGSHRPGLVLQAGFAGIRTQELPKLHALLARCLVGLRQDLGVDREGV